MCGVRRARLNLGLLILGSVVEGLLVVETVANFMVDVIVGMAVAVLEIVVFCEELVVCFVGKRCRSVPIASPPLTAISSSSSSFSAYVVTAVLPRGFVIRPSLTLFIAVFCFFEGVSKSSSSSEPPETSALMDFFALEGVARLRGVDLGAAAPSPASVLIFKIPTCFLLHPLKAG